MRRCLALLAVTLTVVACREKQPPVAPAPSLPPPTRVAPPARTSQAAPAPADDPTRFAAFDRENLRRHLALLAFVKKTRAAWDQQARALAGTAKVLDKVGKLQAAQAKAIEGQTQFLDRLDPDGNRSYLTTAHATNLQYLADEYPSAIAGALSGDPKPIAELRAEMDKVEQKIEAWLTELRKAPSRP